MVSHGNFVLTNQAQGNILLAKMEKVYVFLPPKIPVKQIPTGRMTMSGWCETTPNQYLICSWKWPSRLRMTAHHELLSTKMWLFRTTKKNMWSWHSATHPTKNWCPMICSFVSPPILHSPPPTPPLLRMPHAVSLCPAPRENRNTKLTSWSWKI